MSTKSPECWAIDPQASGLRVEVSPDKDILLPFDQFVYGELTTEGQAHLLEMHFATHHVLIHGQNLRRIQNAMQHKELGYVAKLSTNYQEIAKPGQPMILKIEVIAEKPDPKQSQTRA
jgi:hypothetical protein